MSEREDARDTDERDEDAAEGALGKDPLGGAAGAGLAEGVLQDGGPPEPGTEDDDTPATGGVATTPATPSA